jgi:hypothetical protein
MNQNFDFVDRLQARIALLAIGRSTLRSQGAPGMVTVARKFLRDLKLGEFSSLSYAEFSKTLERHTQGLAKRFPAGGRGNWGAARKSLNIFLRDVVYCRPLSEHYKLGYLDPHLELPLDSNCYHGIYSDTLDPDALPSWPGVRALEVGASDELQKAASQIAQRLGVSRVHLDVLYWRSAAVDELNG